MAYIFSSRRNIIDAKKLTISVRGTQDLEYRATSFQDEKLPSIPQKVPL
jgi:hypothetical protein